MDLNDSKRIKEGKKMYRLIWDNIPINKQLSKTYERICLCIVVIFKLFIIFSGEMNVDRICIYRVYSIYIRKVENKLNGIEVSKHHSWFSYTLLL